MDCSCLDFFNCMKCKDNCVAEFVGPGKITMDSTIALPKTQMFQQSKAE